MAIEDLEVDENQPEVDPSQIGQPGVVAADVADGLSWLESIRKDRDERAKEIKLVLGIPTWGPADYPDLAIEFKRIERKELEQFQRQARAQQQKGKKADADAATDADIAFLARACNCVLARNPETTKLERLEKDGSPVRLDTRLAKVLGLDESAEGKNSQTLLYYLSGNDGITLGAMSMKVARWMTNVSAEVEDAILGE
jgi:hypothetical protein